MKNIIRTHPVATFFFLAFGWTWAIVAAMILSGVADDISKPSIFFVLGGIICNVSPSIAAFLITRVCEGKEGVKRLWSAFRIRGGLRLTLIALLTLPVLTALTMLIANVSVRPYVFWPVFSSMGEEFGWRGFILPKLLARFSPLKSGILLGLVWALWHVPMHYIAYRGFGALMLPTIGTIGFVNLTLQSVIMTWLFVKSRGSVRLMVLYHYTITGSSILAGALFTASGAPMPVFLESVISITLFAIFAIVLYNSSRARRIKLSKLVEATLPIMI
jgi:membrane protease YdiL (CAAX protease family)